MRQLKGVFKKGLIGAILGVLFVVFSLIFTPVNSAYAVPETTTTTESTSETTATSDEDLGNVCMDQSGAIGWIICPGTGAIAKAIDGIYSVIQKFLIIQPLEDDSTSTVHIVWEFARDISNVVFVIFILVIVYSYLTGIGISNYNIKRTLPRIIVAAILVNLSYIICQLSVDVSNILGSSLRGFFSSVQETAIQNGAAAGTVITWTDLIAALTGTGALTIGGIALAGGFGAFFWTLIPLLIGAIVSIGIGLITISMRQALVALLVMISPLAFVCLLLPGTENWFNKWKTTLISMLVFYPAFSVLFGAAELAGWAIINSASNGFGVILGLAVQVFPLFFSWSLMKMSGTILGTINSKLHGLASGPLSSLRQSAAEQRYLKRAEYTAKQMRKPFNPLSGGSWNARIAQNRVDTLNRTRIAEENINIMASNDLNARKRGTKIIGYDKNGMPIYSSHYKVTPEMRREYENRAIKLNSAAANQELENTMNTMGTHLSAHGISDAKMISLSEAQGKNFLEYKTQTSAARLNARSDQRFYTQSIQRAAERDKVTGKLLHPTEYHNLIERGAGSDFYVDKSLTGQELIEAQKTSFDATTSVIADAYDAFENERKITTAKYTTYLSRQVSKEVDKVYDQMLQSKNIDGIVAAQNITALRGDYDKIEKMLGSYMDREGYVQLGTDFANTLALNLLSMKNASPSLGRLGKHINVETWRYTNGDRACDYVTMKEYYTGVDAAGAKTKFNAQVLLQGTGLKDIDRTFYDGLSYGISNYLTADNFGGDVTKANAARDLLFTNMTPQLIGAISTFSSGSEQIINTMGFITGAKYDSASDSWSLKPTETAEQTRDFDFRTRKYLSFLTAQNVIDMKTDTFNAIITRLAKNFSGDKDRAKEEFVRIFEDRGIIDQIRAVAAHNPDAIASMRPGIRKTLGL